MTNSDNFIFFEIQHIFQQVFKNKLLEIARDTNADDIDHWDSLTHMELIDAIEKKFNVKFLFKEILSFSNVGDIMDCIKVKSPAI